MRNSQNSDRIGLMHGDVSQKIWVYVNTNMSGWAIDSGVSDKVLSVKGGDTYVDGGDDTQGSFSAPLDHVHQWYLHREPIATDRVWDASMNHIELVTFLPSTTGTYLPATYAGNYGGGEVEGEQPGNALGNSYTSEETQTVTWRPLAATGTLQYMDL